jgi:hypothetical protein
MNEMRRKVKVISEKIWISMDETTDVEGKFVVNTII